MAVDSKYGTPKIKGIPDDEPVFIIRGQDVCAVTAIVAYSHVAQATGCESEFVEAVKQRAIEFGDWQQENEDKVKVPD